MPAPRVRLAAALPRFLAALLVAAIGGAPLGAAAQSIDREAAVFYAAGTEAYQEGRFEEAALLFERAYERHPAPILLYNVARARESAGDLARALEAYEGFLRDAPADAPERRRVERRVEVLRAQLAHADEPTEPAAAQLVREGTAAERADAIPIHEPAPRAPVAREPMIAPWLIAGAGVATVVAAIVIGVLAQSRGANAEAAPNHERGLQLAGEARDFALVANILYIGGGVLTLAGGVWGAIDLADVLRGDRANGASLPSRATF